MKLWMDTTNPAPDDGSYRIVRTVDEAIRTIMDYEAMYNLSGGKLRYEIELIDIYTDEEGFKLIDWLEAKGKFYPLRLRSTNLKGENT